MDADTLRRFYAETTVGLGPNRERLLDVFGRVPREAFLGPGPWQVYHAGSYVTTPSADLSFVYHDNLIALASERGINNGSPQAHAMWLEALGVQPGETVVHVGAGTGYYTAMLAELAGAAGQVIAYELESDLAELAATNLAPWATVGVVQRSAVDEAVPQCDAIYVNAGVSDIPAGWIDALRLGGRLLLPLTPKDAFGVMMLLTRRSERSFAVRVVSGAMFIACAGASDDASSARLAEAFKLGGPQRARSLIRGVPPDSTCTLAGSGWWLSTAPPAGERVVFA